MAEYEEKTEQATPRKRQKAKEKGQVARSKDLISFASIGGVILLLFFWGRHFFDSFLQLTGRLISLRQGTEPISALKSASVDMMFLIMPFLGSAFIVAISAGLLQGGFVRKPLELKFEALNPMSGLKRIFSLNGLTDFLKVLIKFSIGCYLFYVVMKKDLTVLPFLSGMELSAIAGVSGSLLLKALTYGFGCFFVISVIDYILQKWHFERSLRMSRHELKEEYKQTEGDPIIKSRIKSIQKEMARKRMMQEVPKAAVVITNPTHIAVALRYEDKKTAAPQVIAKGAGYVAENIKEIAVKNRIPVVEDKPLARMLYKLDLGSYIPEELYKAVAKILAYIYRLKHSAHKGG